MDDLKKENDLEKQYRDSVNYWYSKIKNRQDEQEEWMDEIGDCIDNLNYNISEIREDLRLLKKIVNKII